MTTVQLDEETRERLKKFGKKGETYDEILNRMMDYLRELEVEELIDAKWERLQEEKEEYIPLDEV